MILNLIYKSVRKVNGKIRNLLEKTYCWWLLKGNNVLFKDYRTSGIPYIMVAMGGKFIIGKNFAMNNGIKGNPMGCYQKCTFFVDRNAELIIGNNVGISQAALICHKYISIGDDVKIGGGVCIYDTDFHSLNPEIRKSNDDLKMRIEKPVIIENSVFIGTQSIILKGVTIGKNSIIGAGSVVTQNVPANQIWAGNPARFIKNI
ncbi:acyltransferase [Bacteroides fragilis]|nr:acyltransferase [Bacteroides fragilis]